jgi:hypothetical protein
MANRREFLKSAAAASVVGARAAAQNQGGKKIRLAVVGGGFGASFHWHEHPKCVVTAVTDLHAERRKRLRDAFRCDSVYDSLGTCWRNGTTWMPSRCSPTRRPT